MVFGEIRGREGTADGSGRRGREGGCDRCEGETAITANAANCGKAAASLRSVAKRGGGGEVATLARAVSLVASVD